MKLFKEKAGVISENPVWVLIDGPYLYVRPTLMSLLCQVVIQWRDDRHLVG